MLKVSDSDYKKFILLATPRTGSTLVAGLLSSHPNALCRHELLNKTHFGKKYPYDAFDEHFRQYLTEEIWDRDKPGGLTAKGFKVMYHTLKHRTEQTIINYLLSEPFYIIHLIRRNVLNVYLSALLSRKLGVWGGVEYPDDMKVTIVPKTFQFFAWRMWDRAKKYDETFQNRKIKIYYEDLCQHQDKVMEEALDLLHLPKRTLFSKVIKQRTRRQSDHITNYWNLKEQFQNTEFAQYFED